MLTPQPTMHRKKHGLAILMLLAGFILTSFATEPAQAEGLPASYRIKNIIFYAQQRNLSCEYAATRIALSALGANISEGEFIQGIGYDDNPHVGFRGNIDGYFGGTYNYGIYGEPIARYLVKRGFNAKMLTPDGDIEAIKAEVSKNRPVVVWIPAGMGWGSPFTAQIDGVRFLLMGGEHAVTIYGYDEKGVYIGDPGYGSNDYYSWATFIRAWGYLGNMAMSVWPGNTPADPNESLGVSHYFYRHWLNEGGLNVFGYPISGEITQDGKIVQYFERARMEWTPNQPLTKPVVLGLVGRELTAGREDEAAFQPIAPFKDIENREFVEQTGHSVSFGFLGMWKKYGLNAIGLPLSEEFSENGKVVQYFERARMELIPGDKPGVGLGLIGSELLNRKNNPATSSVTIYIPLLTNAESPKS